MQLLSLAAILFMSSGLMLNQYLVSGSIPPTPSRNTPVTTDDIVPSKYGKRPIVFSDVDGTLVQYEDKLNDEELDASSEEEREKYLSTLVAMPRSSTGKVGYVSPRTLELLCKIKEDYDGYICLVSGARSTTLAQRAPFFVHEGRRAIDAFSSESGGRLFVNNSGSFEEMTFYGERHDLEPLNALKEHFSEIGFVVDDRDYTHQFRLHRSKQKGGETEVAFDELLDGDGTRVDGVAKTANLGCCDFFPSSSGKRSVGAFLTSKMKELGELGVGEGEGKAKELCIFTCGDDDNDIELAKGDFVDFSIFPKKNGARVMRGDAGNMAQVGDGDKVQRFSFTGKEIIKGERKAWEQLKEDILATEIMLSLIIKEIER
ncbi:hypothetical protein TrLO_g14934 [Triparma laevis f. longispina]|uniref:Uncharacterized protein n=1 Tax=Triparma laevis f. longispina TaxID=1714387 RepID=A0A9W7FNS6_9STRA|nr:hypothetical protein TrLO_g14934 [Triparma laevis f. longispina]